MSLYFGRKIPQTVYHLSDCCPGKTGKHKYSRVFEYTDLALAIAEGHVRPCKMCSGPGMRQYIVDVDGLRRAITLNETEEKYIRLVGDKSLKDGFEVKKASTILSIGRAKYSGLSLKMQVRGLVSPTFKRIIKNCTTGKLCKVLTPTGAAIYYLMRHMDNSVKKDPELNIFKKIV